MDHPHAILLKWRTGNRKFIWSGLALYYFVSVTTCVVAKATLMRRKLRYVSKRNKLVQLQLFQENQACAWFKKRSGYTRLIIIWTYPQ